MASRLGPRFLDWQLNQDPEESWKECHLHARNLLGEEGYQALLEEIDAEARGEPLAVRECRAAYTPGPDDAQPNLFDESR